MKGNRLIECPTCGKFFQSLGYARHRTMHYEQRQREEAQKNTKEELQTAANTTKVDIPCFYACGNQHAGICMSVDGVCENRKLS